MWLIDADVFLLELTHWKGTDGNYHENSQTFYTLDEVMDAIEKTDVEAEPVKRGRWVGTEFDGYADGNPVYYEWKCSACGCVIEDEEPTWNFCPNCGARMDGENDG